MRKKFRDLILGKKTKEQVNKEQETERELWVLPLEVEAKNHFQLRGILVSEFSFDEKTFVVVDIMDTH